MPFAETPPPATGASTGAAMKAPVPPPLLFFAVLLAGVGAARLRPLRFLPEGLGVRLALGLPLFVFAAVLGASAFAAFRRVRTSAQFGEEVSALVRGGPYRFTRNPLYIALVAALLGFALVLDDGWLLAGVPLLVLLLDRLVVRREERFLSGLFGPGYEAYRARVRRWL